jgi:hypothetical protein
MFKISRPGVTNLYYILLLLACPPLVRLLFMHSGGAPCCTPQSLCAYRGFFMNFGSIKKGHISKVENHFYLMVISFSYFLNLLFCNGKHVAS